jgi:hypothetical protein
VSGVLVSEAVGKALADHGVEVVFGLIRRAGPSGTRSTAFAP